MPDHAALRDFARRYTAAWCSQDASSVAAFFSPNGSLKINDAPPAIGRDAIKASVLSFMTAFPDMQVLMYEVSVEGGHSIYRWTFVGNNSGPGGTGHSVRFSGFEEWSFGADGLIAASLGQFDAADYQRQVERGIHESR